MAERKFRIGIIFGGRSGEHEISLASAESVIEALNKDKYEIVPIGITREGAWLAGGDPLKLLQSAVNPQTTVSTSEGEENIALIPSRAQPITIASGGVSSTGTMIDVIFPVLHGTYGEDGTLQGLLEILNLPYVGNGVLASAAGMDKIMMKAVFRAAGFPVCRDEAVLRHEWERDREAVLERIEKNLGYPSFVKPANLGSSVGVSKAHDRRELIAALDLAARYDRRMIVEEGLNVREIECAVLGNEDAQASVAGEIIPANEFYDYEAKYLSEGSQLIIPANLPAGTGEEVRDLAVRAFQALDCAGLARVDFFVERETNKVYLNEVNTLPGFTKVSMYPKLWEASGLPYPLLLDRLIDLALARHQEKQRTTYDR